MMDEYLKVESSDNMPFFGFEVEKMWEKHMVKERENRINRYMELNDIEEPSDLKTKKINLLNAFDKEYFLATRFESKEKMKVVDISTKLIHELN